MSRYSPASPAIRKVDDRHEPTQLMFFGDPHGDFEPIVETVERVRPQAIVLLGDLQANRPLHVELAAIRSLTETWFIHGNHDTDAESYFDHLWGCELADRDLHGRVVQIAGFLFAGLGGIFRESVWDAAVPTNQARLASAHALRRATPAAERWRGGVSLRHRSTIFPEEGTHLAKKARRHPRDPRGSGRNVARPPAARRARPGHARKTGRPRPPSPRYRLPARGTPRRGVPVPGLRPRSGLASQLGAWIRITCSGLDARSAMNGLSRRACDFPPFSPGTSSTPHTVASPWSKLAGRLLLVKAVLIFTNVSPVLLTALRGLPKVPHAMATSAARRRARVLGNNRD